MESGLLIVCILALIAVIAAGRKKMTAREALTTPPVPLRPEQVEVDLVRTASTEGIVLRGARIDGQPAGAYFDPTAANPDDLFYVGTYDRLGIPKHPGMPSLAPPNSAPTEMVGLNDGLPATWSLPDAPPVLLPEDVTKNADARRCYDERRWDALASSAIFAGQAGSSRRVTSAPYEIAGSLSDASRFATEPPSFEAKLLAESYDRGEGSRPVVIPSLTVGDHEPARL